MSNTIQLTINGKEKRLPKASTISSLLEMLQLPSRQVAVEVNRQLIPRELHADHVLVDGDKIEVMSLVGGG